MANEDTLSFQLHRLIKAQDPTFSLKINKLPTFSEITEAWQCLKIMFLWSNEFTY